MRLGLITTSYPRYPGDPAGSFVAGHAAYLAARGFEVEVIAAGDPGNVEPAPADEISIVRVPAGPGLFYEGGAPEALARSPRAWGGGARFCAALAAEVRRRARRWDATVAHWLAPSALAAALAAPAPMLAIAHGGDVHLLLRLGAARWVAALLNRRGAQVAFVSRGLRERFLGALPSDLARRFGARSFVSPIGIDLQRFRPRPGGEVRRSAEPPPGVCFLGRLVPIKGAHVAIEASALWQEPARLRIAGAGPEEARLRRLARGLGAPVDFLGQAAPAERDRLLASASVMVVPSLEVGGRTEGTPVAALEAMAARVPVIASRSGGLADLPVHHVRPGDAAALADAVDRLHDPTERAAQLERQERRVQALDWSVVGPALTPGACRGA